MSHQYKVVVKPKNPMKPVYYLFKKTEQDADLSVEMHEKIGDRATYMKLY